MNSDKAPSIYFIYMYRIFASALAVTSRKGDVQGKNIGGNWQRGRKQQIPISFLVLKGPMKEEHFCDQSDNIF